MANLIALYLLIALGAVLGGPIPPLPLDDLKTMDEPLHAAFDQHDSEHRRRLLD